uniref:Putative DNA primase-like protein n=1 Tax=Pyrococcus abyssi TaxID=29292 RepID=A0A5J6XUQ6_PYRAY|nr:hypothetical protein [Pyrococcus abyssi]QFN51288.1 putative DNA primase-like protein [Pyrococcus abyssi]
MTERITIIIDDVNKENNNEDVFDEIESSPILSNFFKLLESGNLPEEFLGFPKDDLDLYTVFIKRKNKTYWVFNYKNPSVALYKVKTVKCDEDECDEQILVHQQTIMNMVPIEITAFKDYTLELAANELNTNPPIVYKLKVAVRSLRGIYIEELGPALAVEILDRLKDIGGLFSNETLAKEAIDTLLYLARFLDAIKFNERPLAPGIYYNPKRRVLEAYDIDMSMPSRDELREALILLDKITKTVDKPSWRESWPYKFGKAIKWAVVAGLGYAYKVYNEKRRWIPYLLLVGESQTGKTHSVGRVIAEMWQSPFTSSGASWSLYSLSELIASRSSVIVVNEAANLFKAVNKGDEEDNLFNLLKNAPEQYFFRIKNYKNSKKIYPSLATFVFTANMSAPKNEAIRRRFLTIEFTKEDKIPKDARDKFEREIVPQMKKLSAIGRFVFNFVKSDPSILGQHWTDLAELLIEAMYAYADLKIPKWLEDAKLEDNYSEELEAEKIEYVTTWLRKHFNDLYLRNVKKAFDEDADFIRNRVSYVLKANLSEYFYINDDEVVIFRSLLDAIKSDRKDLDIYSFKDLCNLMGWEYTIKKVRGKSIRVGVVKLEDFLEQIAPLEETKFEREVDLTANLIVKELAIQPRTIEELKILIDDNELILNAAINLLKEKNIVFEAEGKLVLNKERAKELGFDLLL